MFEIGTVVDSRYIVTDLCSNAGGMGTLMHVKEIGGSHPTLVLKYCKLTSEESLSRFRREVRVMQQFTENSYVMPVLFANLQHSPPYFVMPLYEHGDLIRHAPSLRNDLPTLEIYFNRMIDCLSQLHDKGILHRDIKPQNFLLSGHSLVVSDLGLCSELDSATAFTKSSVFWGTQGYLPPEFLNGGFKEADVAGDVFMLGKTFYVILSGRDPTYLVNDNIPSPLVPIIERCCAISKASRYQTLASLRQSITSAFDVLLSRTAGPTRAHAIQRAITDRLTIAHQYDAGEAMSFIDALLVLGEEDQFQVCLELPSEIFTVLSLALIQQGHLSQFIAVYRKMSETATYAWSFAETIASNMKVLFTATAASPVDKGEALRVAIIAADRQNRYAAMETCKAMIISVTDLELAQRVHEIMLQHPCSFLESIEKSTCKSLAVRQAIDILQAQTSTRLAASLEADPFQF